MVTGRFFQISLFLYAYLYVGSKTKRRYYGTRLKWLINVFIFKSTRFLVTEFLLELHLTPGAAGYRISTPTPLLACPLLASLDVTNDSKSDFRVEISKMINFVQIFEKTSMKQLRKKSQLLTAYLEFLLDHYFAEDSAFRTGKVFYKLVTPRNPEHRGSQLSLKFSVDLHRVYQELKLRGVVVNHFLIVEC